VQLKQLWRFTLKREEAVRIREEERKREQSSSASLGDLSSTYTDRLTTDASNQSGGGSVLGYLYRSIRGSSSAPTTPRGSQVRPPEPILPNMSKTQTGFNILKHAHTGNECLTVFASMCLATLRLRDLVDVLLLLSHNQVKDIPYPSPIHDPLASLDFPWTNHDDQNRADRILDCFVALREQFSTPHQHHYRPETVSLDAKMAIIARVCINLRAHDCLVALGTWIKDPHLVMEGLPGTRLTLQDYKDLFSDERFDVEDSVQSFVGSLLVSTSDPKL